MYYVLRVTQELLFNVSIAQKKKKFGEYNGVILFLLRKP